MTNSTQRKIDTAPLSRDSLEQALKRVLDAGPDALGQQLRYILALCQMTNASSDAEPYQEQPITVTQARIAALTQVANEMDDTQIRNLVKSINQTPNLEVRLRLLTQLALRISSSKNYRSLVRDLWNLTHRLSDPVARTRGLFQLIPLLTLFDDEPAASGALLDVIATAQSINNTEARIRSLVALAPHLPQVLSIRLLTRVLEEVDSLSKDSLRCNAICAISLAVPQEVEKRALTSAKTIADPNEKARALTSLVRHISPEMQSQLHDATLDAISQIESEEDRAEAIIALAPFLESASESTGFPDILTKALSIAIQMTRRQLRARTLVALAPHLTLDLQGEALAAVHSLSSERDRAMLLAELAPTLPPEMLVASLAIAHTMREQDARVHALTILAHYVPEHARRQTFLDALAAASNLPHHYERVTALIALLDILPEDLKEQVYTNALESTRLIDNENARSRALSLLGEYLPPTLLARSLEMAYDLTDLQQCLNALQGIAPYLDETSQPKALEFMLDCARQMPFDYKRARALISISSLLPTALLKDALVIAEGLNDPYDQVSAYTALGQHLPPNQRPETIAKAWGLLKQIDDGYDRASALAAIAPLLPKAARNSIAHVAGNIIGSIIDEYDQASAISILAPILAEHPVDPAMPHLNSHMALQEGIETALSIPQQNLRLQLFTDGISRWLEVGDTQWSYGLWKQVARHLITLPLADTLLCLGALMPLFQALGGRERIQEIARVLGSR